jgi:hypothetical protein
VSFAVYEESVESGRIIELYRFAIGSTNYDYTSSESAYTDATVILTTFDPLPMKRGKVEGGRDFKVEIEMPSTCQFAQRFAFVPPGERTTLTIWATHIDDATHEVVVRFKGIVRGVGFAENCSTAKITAAPMTASLNRTIPRVTFQALCNRMLYDGRCQVVESTWQRSLVVGSVDGKTITCPGASAYGADFFVGGYVRHSAEYRLVLGQVGDVLTLICPFETSPLGASVTAAAGCRGRILEDCQTKFGNEINHGGFVYVPTVNPFESGVM